MKIRMMLLLLCALLGMAPAAWAEDFYEEMPQALRFTQTMQTQTLSGERVLRCTYPDTASDAVDAQMRELVDAMAARSSALPAFRDVKEAQLDVGAVISRSGESLLSFLTLAEISSSWTQTGVDYDARVYDMETGARVTLSDLFTEDGGAWAVLADAVRTQLTAAFPAEEPDAQALDALCEGVKDAPFTLGAARLTLTYRADALYPGKNTLLHVRVPYADVRDAMTEFGLRQTDNSRFRLVALTFDDGPAGKYTEHVLDVLRQYGAQATFFVIGENIADHADMVAREQDSLHAEQSHTYTHSYPDKLTREKAAQEKEKVASELEALIGVGPTMMRAPGGRETFYTGMEIGYPLIHWALTSKDSGNDDVSRIASRVINWTEDGDIVLMHDLNPACRKYVAKVLEDFSRRGILCVTVEELFLDAGITLEANRVYYSTYHEPDGGQ